MKNIDDFVEVRRLYEEMYMYKEWTKVTRFLAYTLQGVEIREIKKK